MALSLKLFDIKKTIRDHIWLTRRTLFPKESLFFIKLKEKSRYGYTYTEIITVALRLKIFLTVL